MAPRRVCATGRAWSTPHPAHPEVITHMEPMRPRTVVEFVDTTGAESAHRVREVRINGQAVLVAKDSLALDFSDASSTRLTLTLLPTEVHFNHDKEG